MSDNDSSGNRHSTPDAIGYVDRKRATRETYRDLGFRCGLEIHQQLKTEHKLFCRCPAREYQDGNDYDAQLVRHMRPTLSELGEYDGTALMEFRTRKNITYRIKSRTACTYDIDDTPPFPLNREALRIAVEVALLLDTKIVGELHITRKQYLDGSIPTGFQRTAIVGIDGAIPLETKSVRIRQLSIEEDSCREVSDIGHERIYTTDRLGMPLIETVTEPELLTPSEAAEAAQHLRYLARSTDHVNVGLGAARQDVNVSIEGGTRVEIKGVQRIAWIPELTHNEAFRQKALLVLRDRLTARFGSDEAWGPSVIELEPRESASFDVPAGHLAFAVGLPGFADLLDLFTGPGRCFADELSDRLKVIACIEKPNLHYVTDHHPLRPELLRLIEADESAGLLVFWSPEADVETAIETIDERCRLAFVGVPNETRKALADGTTVFERVLPGPDRMYPDTDSAPIPIPETWIEEVRSALPPSLAEATRRLADWNLPEEVRPYFLRRNLVPTARRLVEEFELPAGGVGRLLGQDVRHALGDEPVDTDRIVWVVRETRAAGLERDILHALIPLALRRPTETFAELLAGVGYAPHDATEVIARIPQARESFQGENRSLRAVRDYIVGVLRPMALGNVPLREVSARVEEALR